MCGCNGKAIATPEQIAAAQRAADERRTQEFEDEVERLQTAQQNAIANASS